MATTINDYAFELQWRGGKVNAGLDKLEARLKKLATTAKSISNIEIKATAEYTGK